MKVGKAIRRILKAVGWTAMAALLLIGAVLMLVYSSWSQDNMRRLAVDMLSRSGMKAEIGALRLHFPLDLEVEDLALTMPGPQTISARYLRASVEVLPLLAGKASISEAQLDSGYFSIGAPDTTMYMTIAGREILLKDASVGLANMDIDLKDGSITGGRVAMTLNPDTTAAKPDSVAAEPTAMKIKVERLRLDDFAYQMRMLPTIDSLGAAIPNGLAEGIAIDLGAQTIGVESFTGRELAASYIVPDSATIAATPVVPESTSDSVAPWTISIDTIGFASSRALYTTRGVKPLPGLDFGYIQADSLDLGIHDFYNQATIVRIPLSISATERCGVRLDASGTLDIDSVGLRLVGFNVSTPLGTSLAFNGLLGMGDMTTDPSTALGLNLDGAVSVADVRLMFPAFTPYFATLPSREKLFATVDMGGTAGSLAVRDLSLALGGMVRLKASGTIENAFDPARIGGRLALSGSLVDAAPLKNAILDKATAKSFNIPSTTFDGHVDMNAGNISGALTARTGKGRVALDADWQGRAEAYDVHLVTDRFPVNAFMPLLGVGQVSATLDAKGHGLDLFKPTTALDAHLDVAQAVYQGYDYKGVEATVKIADGHGDINLISTNPNAEFELQANGNLAGDTYSWQASLDGRRIDLHALGFSTTPATVATGLTADASYSPKTNEIAAVLRLNSLDYTDRVGTTSIKDVTAHLNANDSVTNASVRNRDLYAFLSSDNSLDSIMSRLTRTSQVLAAEMDSMHIDIEALQRALPGFTLDISGGSDNIIGDMLSESRSSIQSVHVYASNDSAIALEARVLEYASPTMRLDTISLDMVQSGERLNITGRVDNRPGTFDEWAHVALDGFLDRDKAGITIAQHNIQGKQGYNIGLDAALADSVLTVNVKPVHPTIAYRPWTVNDDNFIKWSFAHRHLDANLHMNSDKSSLAIYTDHIEGHDDHQEELVVNLTDIKLSDWLKLNPFAPEMAGNLSADLRVNYVDKNLGGKGYVTLDDFMYDRRRVGSIRSDIDVSTDLTGLIRAKADLYVDDHKSITLAGALNDSTAASPLALDLSLIHFPLSAANPFLPKGTASLSGTLNGSMDVTGHGSDPRLDGWLQFDSTAVFINMTGTSYALNDVKIPVDSNLVRFNDFAIRGVNDNPLTVNGTVDIRSFANPKVDLALRASNMEIVNTKRAARGADIYGRGFINLGATVSGDMSYMAINAYLTLLSGTNITYVMTDAAETLTQQQTDDMVKFVNFADTAAVLAADSVAQSGVAMLLQATLTVQSGSTINVDLSSNGRNRVSLQPDGTLDFSMQPFGQPRLTGRLNIPKGFVRYTPPFLSEKNFSFEPNSYVAFNGDLMNPILNIHAVDVIKANVTQSGQNSRLVNFDVKLGVTGTLNHMNVAFDLATDDDITVANELQAMSADQRANQAMNMLLYNVYSGPGTRGDANISGNAVYSFLTSQINNWAANTIKGVDLTFGIDQYDRTIGGATSQTTSYSYQVSKSLFNDRFKIVVGGNYSTDANADENFSQNLIKDISFEYFINKAQTMYLRLFRHTGYESILEGEITRTGVGFVYKRKAPTFRSLFRRQRKPKAPAVSTTAITPAQTSEPKQDESK